MSRRHDCTGDVDTCRVCSAGRDRIEDERAGLTDPDDCYLGSDW